MQFQQKIRPWQTAAITLLSINLTACAVAENTSSVDATNTTLVLKSQVQWQHLNPARGDKAPQAGTLWGDRNRNLATGFLLKPKNGFQSPTHIHNVSYRGVVLQGLIHNDDPKAEKMWMPAGSYWTQPKGESHITAAKGENTLAYIEIEQGPYLVKPKEQAFDSGERPVNVDKANLVWLSSNDIKWLPEQLGVKVSYLWGQPLKDQLNGRLVKLPKGFSGKIITSSSEFRVVVVQGMLDYVKQQQEIVLEPGSYFSSQGQAVHSLINYGPQEATLYVRTQGNFELTSN